MIPRLYFSFFMGTKHLNILREYIINVYRFCFHIIRHIVFLSFSSGNFFAQLAAKKSSTDFVRKYLKLRTTLIIKLKGIFQTMLLSLHKDCVIKDENLSLYKHKSQYQHLITYQCNSRQFKKFPSSLKVNLCFPLSALDI